ncbi:MAG: hypothetical protein HOP18_11990 [Deltaproteobacteria bacterium]|nr:hypothetical protein [Deltaproteobacteria bacterium]
MRTRSRELGQSISSFDGGKEKIIHQSRHAISGKAVGDTHLFKLGVTMNSGKNH